jgi:hypothetical protein
MEDYRVDGPVTPEVIERMLDSLVAHSKAFNPLLAGPGGMYHNDTTVDLVICNAGHDQTECCNVN